MDSSDGGKKYPIRLYAEGKSPLQNKSMNHNCQLGNLARVKEAIGNDAWDKIKESSLGLIPKLFDSDYVWSAKTVHFVLTRQLAIESPNEIWVVIGGQPIRFSLYEFAELTGLNTNALPIESCEADYTSFWTDIGVPHGVGPKFDELAMAFGRCRGWDISKRKMFGLLCILHMGIHGIHHNSRMPIETAKRVFKDEDIADYPWGRVAFKSLIEGVKMVQYERNSYTVNGCVHVLLIWAYESIKVLGERFGRKKQSVDIPFLRWGGKRTRDDLEKVILKEIEQHGEVRVRRMIMKPLAEIYPTWDGENKDRDVHNLIVDILEDKFDKGYWEVKQVQASRNKLKGKNVDQSEHPKKDKRKKRSSVDEKEGELAEGPVKKKKAAESMKITRVCEANETGLSPSLVDLLDKMITRFDSRFDEVDRNISGIVGDIEAKLEAKLEGKFEEKYAPRITTVEDKVGDLVNEVNLLKERLGPLEMENSFKNDRKSKVFQEEEVNSPLKPTQITLAEVDDDVLIKEVVKRKMTLPKIVVKEGKEELKGTEEKKTGKEKEGNEVIEIIDLGKEKKQGKISEPPFRKGLSDVLDITDQVAEEQNKLLSESEENEEEIRQRQIGNQAGNLLDTLQPTLLSDFRGPNQKNWVSPPPYPMVGCNGATRMRKGLLPSVAIYDPLKRVEPIKMEKLREFLRPFENIPLSEKKKIPADVLFYRELITPRKDWPDKDYGWLSSEHLSQFLRMLRKRYMNDPSPFYTDRIAFIDPWFVCTWVKDYTQYDMDPKKWKFSQSYFDVVNGKAPADMATNKKWLVDVDLLYLVHQINGDHWVTLEVDLQKEKIDCYDSIIGAGTVESDKNVLDKCRIFTRMIPALLNEVIPATIRKPHNRQLKFRRRRGVPQNIITGDCGVYSLKYIEMLALGVEFEGLTDRNMQYLREKMAAEIFDEVPDMYAQFM